MGLGLGLGLVGHLELEQDGPERRGEPPLLGTDGSTGGNAGPDLPRVRFRFERSEGSYLGETMSL